MHKLRITAPLKTFGLLCVALLIAKSQGKSAVVSGYVLEEGTSTPIAGSEIRLMPFFGNRRTSQPVLTTSTDKLGFFKLRELSPGSYLVVASKDGYVDQVLGRSTPGMRFEPDALLELADGQQKSGLIIRQVPAGTIAGRIVNERGGIASIEVALLHRQYDGWGRLSYPVAAKAQTDSRGQYRLTGIAPGDYYVGAGTSTIVLGLGSAVRQAYSQKMPEIMSDGQYPWRFYPNSVDLNSAAQLTVRAKEGQKLGDITLRSESSLRSIRVRLIDETTGQAPPQRGSFIGVIPRGWMFADSGAWFSIFQSDGQFQTTGVAPGVYWISSYWYMPNGTPTAASGWALAVADVTKQDANVEFKLVDDISITGRVTVEGSSETTAPNLEGIGIRFIFPNAADTRIVLDQSAYIRTESNGGFKYRGLLPGDYRISVEAIPPNLYLKDIRFHAISVLSDPISVRGKMNEPVSVILASNAGRIDGTVVAANGKPAVRSQVVLVPEMKRGDAWLYQDTISTITGSFRLAGIAPGDYKVFAWDSITRFSWFDPEVLKRYESNGIHIHVAEGTRQNVQLTSIAK